jgi:D-3-phosphoglycerate dehydrogenase
MGRIGREVARRGKAFQMEVWGFDPYLTVEQFESAGVRSASVEEILRNADFITVHTPLTPETENLIAAAQFDIMKPTACLVNCARGGIINEHDLAEALRAKRIAGAALDVFTKEPYTETIFEGLENVILTPHLGASTDEAQEAVAIEASTAVAQYFREGMSSNAVNLTGADPFTWQKFKGHVGLAERLAMLAAQLGCGRLTRVTLLSRAQLPKLMLLVAIKGALSRVSDQWVSLVNADAAARERGISIAEELVGEGADFPESIGVRVVSESGEQTAWGALLADGTPKVLRVGPYRMELDPVGTMLFIYNLDRPGVIGRICTVLGDAGVNISEMQNARMRPGEEALTVIGMDGDVPRDVIEAAGRIDGVTASRLVRF